MIQDTLSAFDDSVNRTVVVVAPRILLAEQLCSEFLEHITNVSVLHVHSGETHFFSTTKTKQIKLWSKYTRGRKLIFTTYNSLQRIVDAEIDIHTAYFDEAHNSVKRNFLHLQNNLVSLIRGRSFSLQLQSIAAQCSNLA